MLLLEQTFPMNNRRRQNPGSVVTWGPRGGYYSLPAMCGVTAGTHTLLCLVLTAAPASAVTLPPSGQEGEALRDPPSAQGHTAGTNGDNSAWYKGLCESAE